MYNIYYGYFMKYVRKSITIREDQAKWIETRSINLSRFIQTKLDEEMQNVKEN